MLYTIAESAAALAAKIQNAGERPVLVFSDPELLRRQKQLRDQVDGLTTRLDSTERELTKYKQGYSKVKSDKDNLSAQLLRSRNDAKHLQDLGAENQTLKKELAQRELEIKRLKNLQHLQSVDLESWYQCTKKLHEARTSIFRSPSPTQIDLRITTLNKSSPNLSFCCSIQRVNSRTWQCGKFDTIPSKGGML